MEILAATEEDYAAIIEVWEASVRATHDFLSEEDIQFFKSLILNDFITAVDLYCGKDAFGALHGFVGVSGEKIEMLFLAPQSRGKGLGKLLAQFAVSGLGAKKVDVNEQNPAARGFYEHLGFRVVARSPVDGMGKPFPLLHMEMEPA